MNKIIILVALACVPLQIMLNALALVYLWEWFIVPLGVPAISYLHAMGLKIMVIAFTRNEGEDNRSKDERSLATVVAAGIAYPLFLLLFGWICHYFM